jgi:hypothetical protein
MIGADLLHLRTDEFKLAKTHHFISTLLPFNKGTKLKTSNQPPTPNPLESHPRLHYDSAKLGITKPWVV